MKEIWAESARFNRTTQRLADQARIILKKGWISDLEVLEICKQVNTEEYSQDSPFPNRNTKCWKKEPPNRIKKENTENQNPKLPSTPKQMLMQDKINLELMNKILSEKKTTLPSLRNLDWKNVMIETEKVIKLLANILKRNATQLNELIYAGTKLTCDKIRVP